MVSAKAIALSVVLVMLAAGSFAAGPLGSDYIDNQIDQGLDDAIVDSTNHEDYDDWKTNEDEGDTPLYKRYSFFNLTNGDAYLGGAAPTYTEIGPYVYRQYDRKIDVSFNSPQVSYRTYTYYVYDDAMSDEESGMDLNPETDVIVNINPQYRGVIGEAGSESALVTGFVGPTLQQVVDGLEGDFTNQVQVQGIATAEDTIRDGLLNDFVQGVLVQGVQQTRAGIIDNLQFAINATTAANVIDGVWTGLMGSIGGDAANDAFFNDTNFQGNYGTPIEGVSEFAQSILEISNTSATAILHNGAAGIPGWLADLSQGTGVLGFLQAYENATDPNNSFLDVPTLLAAYGLSDSSQLQGLAGYLLNYLIADNSVVENSYKAANGGQSTYAGALTNFNAQWANITVVPDGLDINEDGIDPDGFEPNYPDGVDMANSTVNAIFDPTNGLALTNITGFVIWTMAAAGDSGLQNTIQAGFGLNTTQINLLMTWFPTFKGLITAIVLNQFSPLGVTNLDQVGYFQFGDSTISSGQSLFDLDPSLGTYPEFWAWSEHIDSSDETLTLANSEALLSGAYNLTDATSVGTFLLLGQQADAGNATALGALNSLFGTTLTATEAGLLASYLEYVRDTFVIGDLASTYGITSWEDLPIFHFGNGAVTGGDSLFDLGATDFYAEYWAYATNVAGASPPNDVLTQSQADEILYGDYNLTETANVALFLQLANAGDVTTINDNWELDPGQISVLVGYIQYLMANPITNTLQAVFDAGGGHLANRTVHQWLWDYNDPLLEFLAANGQDVDPAANLFVNATSVDDARIAEASVRNTGTDDISQINQYIEWEGQTSVDVWASEETIEGTDATRFAPGVEDTDTLTAWVSDILRVVEFDYREDTVVEGIDLLKFVLSDATMASADEVSSNAKYYQNIGGMANMTSSAGIPLFLSKPHFLDADEGVGPTSGINAQASLHDTFIDVEPITGAVMNAAKRLQINLEVNSSDYFTTNVGYEMMPIVWIEEGASITPDQADSFKDVIYSALELQDRLTIAGPAAGVVFALGAFVAIAMGRTKPV